ncbi:MAG: hypothetical protein ACYC61_09230 [Isosphaeraceae bacterium]
MSDSQRLLERIEEGIVAHGGDLGGWTRLDDGELKLFDGRVSLRAEVSEFGSERDDGKVHAHVFTTLHEHDDETLDACLFGMGDDRETALGQAAAIWLMCVAGPIRSFLDDKPVYMTCQAGVEGGDTSKGYCPGSYGLAPGLRAYVGPALHRGFEDQKIADRIDDTKPWFRYAAESAAPRRVHLAKALVISKGEEGWSRELEIDGHDVSYRDPEWPAGVSGPGFGYLTRFAVFEFPRNSTEIFRRAELERTIRHFAENYNKYKSVEELTRAMGDQGFAPELVHEVDSVSTIAFARMLFEPHGVRFSPTVIRARRDGQIETDVPLMSIPAYSRARAVAAQLRDTMTQEEFGDLCMYNAESQAILKALQASKVKPDLTSLKMYPCVIPDLGVGRETMEAAVGKMRETIQRERASAPQTSSRPAAEKKPWWNFR